MRRVLVCGGRDYRDRANVYRVLDMLHEEDRIDMIINGAARGADTWSTMWASNRGVRFRLYRAAWDKQDKSAGPIRNQEMLDSTKPDIVVAFPGGTGTADMVKRARKARVPVLEIPA